MKGSCLLGKVFMALGICMVMLSMATVVNQAQANYNSCVGSCPGAPRTSCTAPLITCEVPPGIFGGLGCFGGCKCALHIDMNHCDCQ